MTVLPANTLPALEVRRTLPAPRVKVFEFWTDPEQVQLWLGGPSVKVPIVEIDLREGGRYIYHLINPDGSKSNISGVFSAVKEPEILIFSWQIENDAGRSPATEVQVEFLDHGAETEVVLTHGGFPDPEARSLHKEGWLGCLDALFEMLS